VLSGLAGELRLAMALCGAVEPGQLTPDLIASPTRSPGPPVGGPPEAAPDPRPTVPGPPEAALHPPPTVPGPPEGDSSPP
jgi:hypothetical protein